MGSELSSILFYIFGALSIICAIAVVAAKNPVTSAMCMALSFAAIAAVFFGMGAQFLGAVQLIVYAGAILVLFLFIVMMLDVKDEERSSQSLPASVAGVIIAGIFAGMVTVVSLALPGSHSSGCPAKGLWEAASELCIGASSPAKKPETCSLAPYGGKLPELNAAAAAEQLGLGSNSQEAATMETSFPDTKLLGQKLFSEYNIAFVILGFALLTGTVGAVAIGRKIRKN